MENLYERLTALIGTPYDESAFQQLISDLGETPQTLQVSKRSVTYLFPETGFNLSTYNRVFESLFLHSGSAAVTSGRCNEYSGNLPAEIKFGDHRSMVQEKLKAAPIKSKQIPGANPEEPNDLWEHYQFGQLEAIFLFRGEELQLGSIAVHCAEDRSKEQTRGPQLVDEHFWDGFSQEALAVIQDSATECRRIAHNCIGSEQLLVGLLTSHESKVAQLLESRGADIESVRAQTRKIIGPGKATVGEHVPLTPRTKKMLELSREEANKLGHSTIRPDHILQAILEDGEGVGPRVLVNLGIDLDSLQAELRNLAK